MPRHTPPAELKPKRHTARPRNIATYLDHIRGRILDLPPDHLNRAATEILRSTAQNRIRQEPL